MDEETQEAVKSLINHLMVAKTKNTLHLHLSLILNQQKLLEVGEVKVILNTTMW